MKKKTTAIRLLIFFVLFSVAGKAQETTPILPLTADSLATGNYKDLLTSFFQLSLNRVIGSAKEVSFSSNPFGVMARRNPSLLIDTSYYQYRHLRNLNFAFAVKLDDSYHFNGFTSGIKYALINQRDETVSRAFVVAAGNSDIEFSRLNDSLAKFSSTIPLTERSKFRLQVTKFIKGDLSLDQTDPAFQAVVKDFANKIGMSPDPKLNFFRSSQKIYEDLKKNFQNKLLWVVGLTDTTEKNSFTFTNIVLSTQVLKGIVDPASRVNVEIDVKAAVQFTHDSLRSGKDLNRTILNFEPGLNLVLKSRKSLQSWAEFKLSGGYQRNFTRLYVGEQRDNITLNGTLRIRIFDDVWLPFEIKYDPKNGNIFGLLNVKANFTGLNKLLKGMVK